MDPFKLHKQLNENSTDLQDFYKDLKLWGESMKKKEETKSPQKPQKPANGKKISPAKADTTTSKNKTTGFTDYGAWDKFDADAECEKMDYDENDESDLTDEKDETSKEMSFLEKEKGNTCVRRKQWDEAIKYYTRAIEYYAYDPIYYANRSLCFLKKDNWAMAESDCSLALKLDDTYVKAYQRRSVANVGLNRLEHAEMDLLKVLELEPHNKESQKALIDLRKKLEEKKSVEQTASRPLSKFASERKQKFGPTHANFTSNQPGTVTKLAQNIDTSLPPSVWDESSDIILVNPINKPPHLRSKAPLRRLEVAEIDGVSVEKPNAFKAKVRERKNEQATIAKGSERIESSVVEKTEAPIVEKTENTNKKFSSVIGTKVKSTALTTDNEMFKEKMTKEIQSDSIIEKLSEAPKNSVQFYSAWKQLQTLDMKYEYLKLVDPKNIPNIFKECLESNVLSQILDVLVKCFIEKKDEIFEILNYLSQVKRFTTLSMFLSYSDKKNLWNLIDYIKEHEKRPKEEVDILIKKYEL